MDTTIYPPVPESHQPLNKDGAGLPHGPGIYFLWGKKSGRVDYVGQTRRLSKRVNVHHFASHAGDYASWVEIDQKSLNFAEAFYIGALRPCRNGNLASHLAGIRNGRRYVSVRAGYRSGDGKPSFVVTWTPTPGNRKRRTFSTAQNAEQEADYIENLMRQGMATVTDMPLREMSTLARLWDQLPPGTTAIQVINFWTENHTNSGDTTVTSSLEEIGHAYIATRSSLSEFSARHISTVRQHMNRLIAHFHQTPIAAISSEGIKKYLDDEIGGAPKTRLQHLITISAFFGWARDVGINKKRFLPYGVPTAAEQVTRPKVVKGEHEVYAPDEFMKLLIFTPTNMVKFMVLGQFAGIRADERLRLFNRHWMKNEDKKIVCGTDVTKTERRRRVDVAPNLEEWMLAFDGDPDGPMVPCSKVYRKTAQIAKAAGVEWKDNALRAGFASYHLELHDDAALTAKNDGHSVAELESTYKSISGVTKKSAREMFSITPKKVLEYAQHHGFPKPEWESLINR